MSLYQSEASLFLEQLLRENPSLEAQRIKARAKLWDRKMDLAQWAQWQEDQLSQNPYVYMTADINDAVQGIRKLT